jgi:serine protease Do
VLICVNCFATAAGAALRALQEASAQAAINGRPISSDPPTSRVKAACADHVPGRDQANLSQINDAISMPVIVVLLDSIDSARAREMAQSHRMAFVAGTAVIAIATGVFFSLVAPQVAFTPIAHGQSSQRPLGYADIVDKVKPAVISVRVKVDADKLTVDEAWPFLGDSPLRPLLRRFGRPDNPQGSPNRRGRNLMVKQGSGFFISPDGYAVTNGHVVENTKATETTTDGGKTYSAKVIGNDLRTDIALIKIEGAGFPFVKFAEGRPRVGDLVLAIGHPFGLGGTVTAGIVSALARDIGDDPYEDFVQIDASVNKGNSGGPTFDMDGNVIGVNTAMVTPSGGSVGVAFAVPADIVKDVVTQLREKGVVSRGSIGVQLQDITPEIAESLSLKERRGALVAEPQANGPAAKAGIEAGDVITAVNGKEIGDSRELARIISRMSPGTPAQVTISRKGQDKRIALTVRALPERRETKATSEAPSQRGTSVSQLGLSVAPRSGREGVAISDVNPDGIAAGRGIQNGDVIVEAAGKKISSATDLRRAVEAAQKGKHSVLLRIKSGDAAKFVALPLDHG